MDEEKEGREESRRERKKICRKLQETEKTQVTQHYDMSDIKIFHHVHMMEKI